MTTVEAEEVGTMKAEDGSESLAMTKKPFLTGPRMTDAMDREFTFGPGKILEMNSVTTTASDLTGVAAVVAAASLVVVD